MAAKKEEVEWRSFRGVLRADSGLATSAQRHTLDDMAPEVPKAEGGKQQGQNTRATDAEPGEELEEGFREWFQHRRYAISE